MACKVVSWTWSGHQKAHGGHRRAEVVHGQTVYAIKHSATGLYFYYAYLDEHTAQTVCNKMDMRPGTLEANFKSEPRCVTTYQVEEPTKPLGGCPHCGYRHPPDGMCI